ncbi:UDP-glucose 6-dehydrogenase [Rhizocola hellebori]|uniref:UDP-glucose 6-dehydrogenase n=1 Tax=Rhizocola hellebori TaxID=1392758 RepID=A0A8J3VEW9_9ACTN|nr:UDP-glucose/GDP-mannose dehydrogenase family protein [Rhizocola hellebori]GIH03970.1 UDP-glucose 6-dehydrogenase [Rhizocola hellebori]
MAQKICIVGTGYVGLTTGICLAFLGHEVTCVDVDQAKISALHAGDVPIYEPHLRELMALAAENLSFTTSYADGVADADVVFIAVNTPTAADGSPDLRYLRAAAQSIGETLGDRFTVVVNKSTVPIGSGNWVGAIVRDFFEATHPGTPGNFQLASNPEFLREGTAIGDTLYADRVVVGSDDPRALEVLSNVYRPILDQTFTPPAFLPRPENFGVVPLVSTDLASAELIKYAANSFLALKISYINEIAQLAERVGADIAQVALGTGLDTRIGRRFLGAGIGWGGSCFGKDTAALITTAREYKLDMPIVAAARETNQRQRELVVEKLLEELRIIKGCTIGILGLAFKPDTDDLRDAPAIDIAQRLISRGARVRLHDPVAMGRLAREFPELADCLRDEPAEVVTGADAVVLATEWAQYRQLDWKALAPLMRSPILLDGRHTLDRQRLTAAGFRYIAVAAWNPPR